MAAVSTPSADVAQSSATFSYAQAAKGQVTTSASSPASKPEAFSWADDSADTTTATEDARSSIKSHDSSSKSSESEPSSSRPPPHDDTLESLHSTLSEFVMVSPITAIKDTDAAEGPKSPSDLAWESKSQSSSSAAPAQGANEERGRSKGRSGKEKSVDEIEEKTPEITLKEAPIPTVNFWQQRLQEARAKKGATSPQLNTIHSNPASQFRDGPSPGAVGLHNNSTKPTSKQSANTITGANISRRENTDRTDVEDSKFTGVPSQGVRQARAQKSQGITTLSNPPPSVRDETSWPTPLNAQDEDRRKAQEKGEKVEKDRTLTAAPKSHGKNEWKPVAYTPSVKFNTPMPPGRGRGGRGGLRGGRGGAHIDRASTHPQTSAAENTSTDSKAKEGHDLAYETSASIPPAMKQSNSYNKALVNEQPSSNNEDIVSSQVNIGNRSTQEMEASEHVSKDDLTRTSTHEQKSSMLVESTQSNEGKQKVEQVVSDNHMTRRRSTAQNEPTFEGAAPTKPKRRGSQTFNGDKDRRRSMMESGGTVDKPNWSDSKNELSHHNRERDANRETWTSTAHRERGEGRGRGYKSGRGNHPQPSHFSMAQNHNGSHLPPIHTGSNHPSAKGPQSYHSQHYSQSGNFTSGSRGGYRNGSRSATTPSEASINRYAPAYGNAYQYPYNTTYMNGIYDYSGVTQMNAAPFNPYVEQTLLVNEIATQLSYYFSLENMIKDLFLRKHMDSQGFLPLALIANFKRMKELTTDLELIKYVCLQSEDYELRVGLDGKDRLRKRVDWAQWVLPMADRDSAARNEGPAQTAEVQTVYSSTYSQPIPQQHNLNGYYPQGRDVHSQSFSAAASSFSPLPIGSAVNGFHSPRPTLNGTYSNGADNGSAVDRNELQPSISTTSRQGMHVRLVDEPDSHVDEQTQQLKIVVRPLGGNASNAETPSEHIADVTSNGPNGYLETEHSEGRRSRSRSRQDEHIEGERAQQLVGITRNSMSPSSLSGKTVVNSSGFFWIKENEMEKFLPLPAGAECVPYEDLHNRAIQQREDAAQSHTPYDMFVLYNFWSHFLIRNFNTSMYREFQQLAHEDASNNSTKIGMERLIDYYSKALSSQYPIRQIVARDYVDLVEQEQASKMRPAFDQLRSAWRNGATNMKNRKKISDFVDADLSCELDR